MSSKHVLETKICSQCGKELSISEFYRHTGHSSGLRSECKECTAKRNYKRYHEVTKSDPEEMEQRRERGRRWYNENAPRQNVRVRANHRKEREACIAAYGGACECCGETRYEFLAIDHINGGGRQHREKIGNKICRWLVKNNFPPGFRVLCHNCNLSIGHYGYCPHERERIGGQENE